MGVTCRYRGACFAAWQRVMPTMEKSCNRQLLQATAIGVYVKPMMAVEKSAGSFSYAIAIFNRSEQPQVVKRSITLDF
jgi:hypothetical protein